MTLLFLHYGYVAIYRFCFCSSPLKVKEDDEVDKLEIKINTPKRSKRTYPSPSPEVAMKISRSLRVSYVSLYVERHIHNSTHICSCTFCVNKHCLNCNLSSIFYRSTKRICTTKTEVPN